MKEAFIEKNFGSAALAMIARINGIIAAYEAEGYDLSLRQLYYRLVAANVVENTERSYKNVGNLVSDARLAGYIDWDMIKDRGREMVRNSHWDSPKDILTTCASQFAIDRRKDQPAYVEVMVEKQALEGVLIPVCQKWDVPFTANKGYSSSSALYEASKRFLAAERAGKDLYVLYLGDHDASGMDMTRDVDDRMDLFLKVAITGAFNDDEGSGRVEVKRLALNMDQVEQYDPPENPAKLTDSRAAEYIRRFGRSSWELDALEPKVLASLVTKAIRSVVDFSEWERSGDIQQGYRDDIQHMADTYKPRKKK